MSERTTRFLGLDVHKATIAVAIAEESGPPVLYGTISNDPGAVRKVMRLVDRLGFDPVDAGPLKNGLALEPDGSPVAATYSVEELVARLVA